MELVQVFAAEVLHVVLMVLSHEMEAAEAGGEYTPAARPAKASKSTLLIFIVTSFWECPALTRIGCSGGNRRLP